MIKEEKFNLSSFITDSLNLKSNASPARMMYPSVTRNDLNAFERDPLEILGENNFDQPKDTPEYVVGTPIQEFFRGTNVLITGGTGFIGKVLTEKLLRSVPHLGHIYILIRSKRGKSPKERFDELLEDRVFLRMKTEVPDYYTKLSFVGGDISKSSLGLNIRDLQLLLNVVNIVFHSAADVRFVEPLRTAINSNVFGSRNVMDLAKEMKHLKSYVHVSTAYSQCVRREIEETIPKMSINYKEILNEIDSKTDDELQKNISRIMLGWPNTYTFSKAISEEMIQEESQDLPLCIVRPSVVVNTYREPVRGYTDNLYGPLGLMVGVLLGVLHCYELNKEIPLDYVSVDYVINCMIAAAWRTGTFRYRNGIPVYNFTSTSVRPMSWKQVVDFGLSSIHIWPMENAIWCPSIFLLRSEKLQTIGHIFLHKIPGKILDSLAVLSGQKPRLSKIYEKMDKLREPIAYFSNHVWVFKNNNVMDLWHLLDEEDKQMYNFDLRNVDLNELYVYGKLGLKYYYLKEKIENMPAAQVRYRRLYWVHNALKLFVGLVILKIFVYIAHILPF